MNPFDIFDLILAAAASGSAIFFYDARVQRKSCFINDLVFEFEEQEEGSLAVRHQNLFLLWMRETKGWSEITDKLATVVVDENSDSSGIRRRIFSSVLRRLSQEVREA